MKALVRNQNLTVMKSLSPVPVMNQSPIEVQIQSLNQIIVTRVVMTHQVHHLDSTSSRYIFMLCTLVMTHTHTHLAVLFALIKVNLYSWSIYTVIYTMIKMFL